MGFQIEICDTLKLKRGINFPKEPIEIEKTFQFTIDGIRLYNLFPSRAYLVEEIEGKWNYVGHIQILEQTINAIENTTSGYFKIVKIYNGEYVSHLNQNEAPSGRGYSKKQL